MGYEFITGMGLKIDYVSVFEGAPGVPADLESEKSGNLDQISWSRNSAGLIILGSDGR